MKAYLLDQNRLLPCCAYLNGEYGYKDLCVGVPVVINAQGIAKVLELKLSDDERAQFNNSVESVKNLINALKV